jgi:hypothetical protein
VAGTVEYLPPLVTKFLADTTELRSAFDDLRDESGTFGKDVGVVFADSFKESGAAAANQFQEAFATGFDDFETDVDKRIRVTAKKQAEAFGDETEREVTGNTGEKIARAALGAGEKMGTHFLSGFGGTIKGLMGSDAGLAILIVGGLIAAVPAAVFVGTLIGAALLTGLAGGFVGLGAFLLQDDKKIVAAATKLANTTKKIFKDAAFQLQDEYLAALRLIEGSVVRLGPKMKEAFAQVAPAIVPLADGLMKMVENAMPGLIVGLEAGGKLLTVFAGTLPQLGEDLSFFFSKLAEGGPEFAEFIVDMMNLLGDIIRVVAIVIVWLAKFRTAVKAAILDGAAWINESREAVEKWGSGVAAWFGRAKDAVTGWFSSTWQSITAWVAGVGEWFTSAGDNVGGFFDRVGTWFSELPGKIWEWLTELPEIFAKAFWTAFDAVFYVLGYVGMEVFLWFSDLPRKVGVALATLVQVVGAAFVWIGVKATQLGQDLLGWAVQTWNDVTHWFHQLGVDLAAWAAALPAKITVFFMQLWADITSWVSRTYHEVLAWFQALPGNIVIWLGILGTKIQEWASGALSWLRQAGVDMVMGLINGINSAVQSAIDTARRAVGRIIEGARDALDSHSPSRVFMGLGKDTMEGYAIGIAQNASLAADAVRRALTPAGAYGAIGGDGAAIGATMRPSLRGSAGTPIVVQAGDTYLDGKLISLGLIPHAQRTKDRTGTSGLN